MTEERSVFGGETVARTRDGRVVRVVARHPELQVVIDQVGGERGRDVARVSLPYPSAGYGGHELLLSPRERYLAMWLYSGQSEVGYELFALEPALEHLASLPYVRGVGYGPAFSDDERRIALAWSTRSGLCLDEAETDGDGLTVREEVVDWARVHVREIGGATSECRIDVRVPAGFPWEGDDSYYPERLALADGELRLETGWGEPVRIPLPLPESITVPGPRSR